MQMSRMGLVPTKFPPKDADTVNHKLLVQAGFVRQVMAGVYAYLPLGLRTLNKISAVVRTEMNGIGGQEILMPALHPSANWKTTGAWDTVDVLFKLKSRTGKDYALGQSHEEIVTPIAKEAIKSYKDLPLALYQIQWKYRDELRAKSGILRGREFLMKDMYSFHETQDDFNQFYQKVKDAYLVAFKKLGLTAKVTEASGGAFSQKVSYEFMVLTDAGEDDILYCTSCDFCVNTEIAKQKEGDKCPRCLKDTLKKARASEVGNVFDLGIKYSKDFEVNYINRQGDHGFPIMGCYGFGISRTMGVLVEHFHDDHGIVWPAEAAPFTASLITLDGKTEESEKIYKDLNKAGIDVLWDDRDISAGSKFADADLIGNPYRIVVSERSEEKGGVELKGRSEKEGKIVSAQELAKLLHV
jgi:prolyl-tRNA synthetase